MKILHVKYNNVMMNEAVYLAMKLLERKSHSNLFFLNADCLYKAQSDFEYRNILNEANLVFPDGIGFKIATFILGQKLKDNCNGTDFSPLFLEKVTEKGYTVFFLGGRPDDARRAAINIRKRIPGLRIVGSHSGYFSDDKAVIAKINKSKADILFVARGVPLQEKWIYNNRDKLNPKLCLGVGALIDYLSGRIRRAPRFFRKLHLEWFWRIFIEPKRMIKRYVFDSSKFFMIVFKEKIRLMMKKDSK